MMQKLNVFLDPHWRTMDELFSQPALEQLNRDTHVIWGRSEKASDAVFAQALPDLDVLVSPDPQIDADLLNSAPKLKTIIEVSGAFPDTIDYAACQAKGVEVLSCAPGFQQAVAEMGLGMALASGRGLMAEHENFRKGQENWLSDNLVTDFTLFNANIGFIGFGSIAQATHKLLKAFAPKIWAFDPWINPGQFPDVTFATLEDVAKRCRCVFITASPTQDNQGMIDAKFLANMQDHAVLVVISRAHLVNFPDLVDALSSGRIRAAIDVFPEEPTPMDHPLRSLPNVILSPHRAAAVAGGRQLIGDMIVDDLKAIASNDPKRRLSRADPTRIASLLGVGDAASVADMAVKR